MKYVLVAIGALGACLFFVAQGWPEILRAQSTGVLYRKGHDAKRIERAVEPERFAALLSQRSRQLWMMAGLALLLAIGAGLVGALRLAAKMPG